MGRGMLQTEAFGPEPVACAYRPVHGHGRAVVKPFRINCCLLSRSGLARKQSVGLRLPNRPQHQTGILPAKPKRIGHGILDRLWPGLVWNKV